jgi:hypothetical protein
VGQTQFVSSRVQIRFRPNKVHLVGIGFKRTRIHVFFFYTNALDISFACSILPNTLELTNRGVLDLVHLPVRRRLFRSKAVEVDILLVEEKCKNILSHRIDSKPALSRLANIYSFCPIRLWELFSVNSY